MRLLSATLFLTLLAAACTRRMPRRCRPRARSISPRASLTLHAQLYKPDGDGPFPTVIALHGCGGLGGQSEPVQSRYRDWAEQLLKTGHAVLLPDSYGSRELGPQCRVKERRVLARRERVADVKASRQWLLQQPWAARDRISLIGWANGASAVLWAVRPQLSSRGTEPDFRSAIAFYPDCRISSGLGWSARVPTLLLIGAQGRRQFAAGLPPDGGRRPRPQRAGADRGLSRRASRFRPRQPAAAGDRRLRRRVARTRPYRHRCGRAQRTRKSASRSGWRARTGCPDRPAWPRASAPPASPRAAPLSACSRRAPSPCGRSASAVAPTRPSANSIERCALGPIAAAACTAWPCSSRTRAKPRASTPR